MCGCRATSAKIRVSERSGLILQFNSSKNINHRLERGINLSIYCFLNVVCRLLMPTVIVFGIRLQIYLSIFRSILFSHSFGSLFSGIPCTFAPHVSCLVVTSFTSMFDIRYPIVSNQKSICIACIILSAFPFELPYFVATNTINTRMKEQLTHLIFNYSFFDFCSC